MRNNLSINNFERIIFRKYLKLLMETSERHGISHTELLKGTQLSEYSKDNMPPHISQHTTLKISRNMLDLFNDPAIGLEVGARLNVAWYGLIGFAMMTSETLKAGLDVWSGHKTLIKSATQFKLEVEAEKAQLILFDPLQLNEILPFEVSVEFATLFTVIRNITGGAFRCSELQISFSPPFPALYEDFFSCPLVFCHTNALVFDRDFLYRPLPLADHDTHDILTGLCNDVIQSSQEDTLISEIRETLSRQPDQIPSMSEVATALGMSSRTLHRRLTKLDCSYQELVNRMKQSIALEYVTDSDLSIEDIATRVGYADAANFRSAFKTWTGETPMEYRRAFRESLRGQFE